MCGPNAPTRIPMMMGPPAIPSRMGESMPGKLMGMAPKASPKIMPKKILPTFGSLSVLTELPKKCSALSTLFGSPTTVRRSPYCNLRSLVASNLTSPRVIRLTLTPKLSRKWILPSSLPLRAVRVNTMTRDSTLRSI